MDAFIHCALDRPLRRDHPYTFNPLDPHSRYVDFKRWPELIRTTLEDFAPVASTPAAAEFFSLLERINGPDSILESNDCTFTPPGPNTSPAYPMPVETKGRLMLLYRDLLLNQDREAIATLTQAFDAFLRKADPGLRWGAVRISHDKMNLGLFRVNGKFSDADQVTLNFWAWGRDSAEALANVQRVFAAISSTLDDINSAVVTIIGKEDIILSRRAQRSLEERTYVVTTHARNFSALAASVPPEVVADFRAGRSDGRTGVLRMSGIPTHVRRVCDSELLCGASGRDYGQLGGGNATAVYLEELNLCRGCKSVLRKHSDALLDQVGMTLAEVKALLQT